MKVLLLKDVYNLGRAGEVKKVANGYGRNYLIPQNLAMLATPGALKQIERITVEADKRRTILNEEMEGVSQKVTDLQLLFAARAGETGKLYGSVTSQMIAEELSKQLGAEIGKRQIDSQPLRLLGMHTVKVRLTVDIIPEFSVVVYREGEAPENYMVAAEELADQVEEGTPIDEVVADIAETAAEEVAEEDAGAAEEDAGAAEEDAGAEENAGAEADEADDSEPAAIEPEVDESADE